MYLEWSLMWRGRQVRSSSSSPCHTFLLSLGGRANVDELAFRFFVYKSSHQVEIVSVEFSSVEVRRRDEMGSFEECTHLYP